MSKQRETLSTTEAAKRLGISPRTLQVWVAKGEIEAIRKAPAGRNWLIPLEVVERAEREMARESKSVRSRLSELERRVDELGQLIQQMGVGKRRR